jgi:predicted AlkP superfamily pyrophosphatase or phosphodiesterase
VTTEPPTTVLTSTSSLSADAIEHVLIITIDGMRPDGLEQADTPTLDNLRAKGAYSPNAQTVNPSFTLPSHVSMLNGAVPQKHGIVEALPCIGCRLTIGPTLFSEAHDAGYSTGMVFGKEKLNYLNLPGSVDKHFGIDAHDLEVKDAAVEIIETGMPNVLFVHFPDTDRVGHEYGWMSPNYLYAISYADGMIGEIVTTLEREDYLNSTLMIITSDHGGHDFEHGLDCPEDRTIPWLAVGPGVPEGTTLPCQINTYDTAATALYALGLPIPECWDGQPVLEIFE